jgi:hypothetical protein
MFKVKTGRGRGVGVMVRVAVAVGVTVGVRVGVRVGVGVCCKNTALTPVAAEGIAKEQTGLEPEQTPPPPQYENPYPCAGLAVRITATPLLIE